MDSLSSLESWTSNLEKYPVSVLYIGSDSCDVCQAMKPKIMEVLKHYPSILVAEAKINQIPELSGTYLVFTVPTVLIFSQGKEIYRTSRYIDLKELELRLKAEVEQ